MVVDDAARLVAAADPAALVALVGLVDLVDAPARDVLAALAVVPAGFPALPPEREEVFLVVAIGLV